MMTSIVELYKNNNFNSPTTELLKCFLEKCVTIRACVKPLYNPFLLKKKKKNDFPLSPKAITYYDNNA